MNLILISKTHLRSAARIKSVFCKNGGAFIKVGQHVGSLDYLLPAEYVQTMKELHNKAPESDVKDLFKTIEEDLKKKVFKLYTTYSEHVPVPYLYQTLESNFSKTIR